MHTFNHCAITRVGTVRLETTMTDRVLVIWSTGTRSDTKHDRSGSNAEDLIRRTLSSHKGFDSIGATVVRVVTDKEDCGVYRRAEKLGVPVSVVSTENVGTLQSSYRAVLSRVPANALHVFCGWTHVLGVNLFNPANTINVNRMNRSGKPTSYIDAHIKAAAKFVKNNKPLPLAFNVVEGPYCDDGLTILKMWVPIVLSVEQQRELNVLFADGLDTIASFLAEPIKAAFREAQRHALPMLIEHFFGGIVRYNPIGPGKVVVPKGYGQIRSLVDITSEDDLLHQQLELDLSCT